MKKLLHFEELGKVRKAYPGKKIVLCHGVFDLFHYGHLLHLQSAKTFGDILVVTITPDRFVNKGPDRPRYSDQQRASLLAALEIVDHVAINITSKAIEPITTLRPHIYVKGPDYRDKQKDITGAIQEEEDAVKSVGGRLVFTNDETNSSTELLNQYFSQWTSSQIDAIKQVKKSLPLESILRSIDKAGKLRVLVIGEPIVDTYVFCQAESLSTKSPTVSARFLEQEDYAGGSLAIANHLKALGCDVTLLFTHGDEPYFHNLLKPLAETGISIVDHPLRGIPTPRKTRYMVPFRAQRIFELIDLRADQWAHAKPAPFITRLEKLSKEHDIVIVADFGHGLFEGAVLEKVSKISTFIALNAQTNSGNYGYNPFTKHRRYDYLSIDERECRLAMHDRFTPIEELARRTVKNSIKRPASITLSTVGSAYFDEKGREHLCPTFFKEVIDTTGAGDAYFALTSLFVKLGLPGPVIPFLGNCFAGLKTRIIGNKAAVSKVDLIRTVQTLLK